jgi:hypothetical protein
MACLAPGARADEYTKQTFMTFSGPVQLPGIVLPAGTYQFRLADPDSGRRVLQVWDKDGNKLLTTLLTIPDQRMTPASEPVVMFSERPSGEPQAVRAWFYPNESYGQEFVYPKEQAMKIAKDTHKDVLSYEGDAKDEAAFKAAKVGRVDENGTMTDANKADATAASAASPSTAQPASTTTASSASTTTADNSAKSDAAASSAPSRPSQTASDNTGNAAMPSANRSGAPAAVGTSGTTIGNSTSEANRDNTNVTERAVGSTGRTASANSANRTAQAAAGGNAAAPRAGQSNTASAAPARQLPRTASSTALVQLLAALSLAAAVGLRVFRARAAESR